MENSSRYLRRAASRSILLSIILIASHVYSDEVELPNRMKISGKIVEGTGQGGTRTKAEVQALIAEAGATPPEWWDAVSLKYPRTLLLNWPKPKKGEKWTPSKYPGQYIISVINPNPGKWRQGAKLLHHMLSVNRNNPKGLQSTMDRLGHVYANLLGDHARGAYWRQKAIRAARRTGSWQAIGLADCYWKLGSKDMTVDMLRRMDADRTRNGGVIKLWSDIGELRRALSLADQAGRSYYAWAAYRAAGDACRAHGQYKKALSYYQKVLGVPATGKRRKEINKTKNRARACMEAIRVFEALDLSTIPSGAYTGSADGYRGPVHVEVGVQDGRIGSVKITQHKEDWFYTSFTSIPEQIIRNQGLKGVDAVTGATMTSEAIINACARALASGME